MLDLKMIRSNPDDVKAAIKKREMDLDAVVDEILELDEQRRKMTAETEAMKARQNAVSKQIQKNEKQSHEKAGFPDPVLYCLADDDPGGIGCRPAVPDGLCQYLRDQ